MKPIFAANLNLPFQNRDAGSGLGLLLFAHAVSFLFFAIPGPSGYPMSAPMLISSLIAWTIAGVHFDIVRIPQFNRLPEYRAQFLNVMLLSIVVPGLMMSLPYEIQLLFLGYQISLLGLLAITAGALASCALPPLVISYVRSSMIGGYVGAFLPFFLIGSMSVVEVMQFVAEWSVSTLMVSSCILGLLSVRLRNGSVLSSFCGKRALRIGRRSWFESKAGEPKEMAGGQFVDRLADWVSAGSSRSILLRLFIADLLVGTNWRAAGKFLLFFGAYVLFFLAPVARGSGRYLLIPVCIFVLIIEDRLVRTKLPFWLPYSRQEKCTMMLRLTLLHLIGGAVLAAVFAFLLCAPMLPGNLFAQEKLPYLCAGAAFIGLYIVLLIRLADLFVAVPRKVAMWVLCFVWIILGQGNIPWPVFTMSDIRGGQWDLILLPWAVPAVLLLSLFLMLRRRALRGSLISSATALFLCFLTSGCRGVTSGLDSLYQSRVLEHRQALAEESNPQKRIYHLARLADAEMHLEQWQTAEQHALKALEGIAAIKGQSAEISCPDFSDDFHASHSVLGRVALRRGDRQLAKQHLLDSLKDLQPTPAISSFGPEGDLARELLEIGERAVVIEYLTRLAPVWTRGTERVHTYQTAIRWGLLPKL